MTNSDMKPGAGLPLSRSNADKIEAEMRRLEADPAVTKTELRVFMQLPMPCGHAIGNLLTCPEPPYGCVICGSPLGTPTNLAAMRKALVEREVIIEAGRDLARLVLSRVDEEALSLRFAARTFLDDADNDASVREALSSPADAVGERRLVKR